MSYNVNECFSNKGKNNIKLQFKILIISHGSSSRNLKLENENNEVHVVFRNGNIELVRSIRKSINVASISTKLESPKHRIAVTLYEISIALSTNISKFDQISDFAIYLNTVRYF